jgi:RNA polymerase sigma-70 factor (ECF subfamily)
MSQYKRPVFSLVYRTVRQREDAEDLTQETFIRAFRALSTYDPQYRFSSWLFKIASNLCIDHLRRQRGETVSLDDEEAPLELPDIAGDPEDAVVRKDQRDVIERAIEMLPPDYRLVILLRHREERSYEEIAEIMGIPLGTVKAKVHRARGALKERLRKTLPVG